MSDPGHSHYARKRTSNHRGLVSILPRGGAPLSGIRYGRKPFKAFVVARARYHLPANRSLEFRFEVTA